YYDKSIPDEETLLNVVDFHRSRTLGNFDHKHVNDSAMYAANRFEGDIVSVNIGLNSHSVNSFFTQQPLFAVFGVQRNAVKQTYLKWTDGRIPYTISSQYSSYRQFLIYLLEYFNVTERRRIMQKKIYSINKMLFSGGKQPVSLGDGCIQKGIIIHELMHVVGFFHEQSRADRDDHIIINWSNVESGLQDQFDKYSLQMIDHLNTVYDYGSVMHYASTAFSKNGKPTIEPRKKGAEIGQRTGFSDIDLYKINKLYNCPQAETTSSPLPETKTDMKSEARASVKTDKKGPTGSGSVAGSASTSEKSSLISVLTKVACTDNICEHLMDNSISTFQYFPGKLFRRPDCEFLARAGHCESKFSETFMKDNCPQSCGKCEITTTTATTVMEQCEDARYSYFMVILVRAMGK
ncbi:shTK domain protein, partial [Necator americanus]